MYFQTKPYANLHYQIPYHILSEYLSLTNEKLIEGYIGNEGDTLQRTNLDENPDQTYIDKINAKINISLVESFFNLLK